LSGLPVGGRKEHLVGGRFSNKSKQKGRRKPLSSRQTPTLPQRLFMKYTRRTGREVENADLER